LFSFLPKKQMQPRAKLQYHNNHGKSQERQVRLSSDRGLIEVGDGDFQTQVVLASGLTLVIFGGPACAPCVAMEPMLNQLAREQPEHRLCKIDADLSPETAAQFGVRGLPTLLLFKGGKVVERVIGAQSKKKLEQMLQRHST
jgi:thioredoxin 1